MKEKTLTTIKLIKKHWVKPFISLALIVILFCNSSEMNLVAQAATDPETYYQKVEKENLNKQVDKLTKAYSSYITNYQNALKQQIGQEITLQATLDSYITDNTSMEGLRNIKATMISMVKGKDSKTNMAISCNDQTLTSIEAYTIDNLLYVLIPDLSKSFLKIDPNSLEGDTTTTIAQDSIEKYLNDPISEELINKLLKKYGTIVIDTIDNVTMKENVSVIADNIESNYTKLTVSINEKDVIDITKAILDAAKTDTDLRDLCIDLGLCTKKEYNAAIDEGITGLTDSLKDLKESKSNGEIVLKMYLWVNSLGKITGRSLKIDTGYETMDLGYQTTKKGTKMGVEAWIKSDKQDVIRGTGSLTAGLKGVSGNLKITYTDSYLETSNVTNIDFKNVKYTKNDAYGFLNGEFTVTNEDLLGMSFNMNFTGDIDKQDFLFDMLQDNKSIATVSTSIRKIPFSDFSVPASNDNIFDMNTQLNEYLQTANVTGFLDSMKAKSDVTYIDSYMDQLLEEYKAYIESKSK